MAGSAFVCHERLAADTVLLGLSRLCQVRLMNDRTWPWVLLVPAVPGIREIYELAPDQRQRLMEESCLLGEAMMTAFGGDKLNVAALGNMVPQLHLHHIVRHQGDPAWPGPVWGRQAPVPYDEPELARVRQLLAPAIERLA
ncbi:HIT family protein [Marinobacter lutaoensis]|jgi:diadenosine tetraphosphate (Ap4A) HIT family hydrolase|uniref:HIT family protein n=1 Tax=Marinobacter lutaoensis TaxID=135739 RepID=A0A1V2DXG5_9GAMM|nr:HIT family protein [Marinobacter lutaoensis]MBE02772.1 HIT family protein [Marinobacter sp.]MBI42504.1 HIT family protein [Oceanospirillales bacterium]NVD35428.1 HIT family protein [Marinobacter lutaoensis]ONF45383.1 HIT family protein [Marinobacter lutaoensis]|tara:strand:- start:5376 stop:5798 length:423 start_codon:yes stop_codon:yes gene_type:complete